MIKENSNNNMHGTTILAVRRKNNVVIKVNEKKIVKKVFKRKYKIQRIDGLEEKKINTPKES